ncbi:MAG: hypothetical protein P1P84_03755 [Deferrisomatales bacterium]|nr:hypothetical protein [Deferrisomatales bacterium]
MTRPKGIAWGGLGGALLLLTSLVFLALDSTPTVPPAQTADVNAAVRTRRLVKKTWRTVKHAQGDVRLVFTEEELNSVAAFVARGTGRLAGRTGISADGVDVALTLRLPELPLRKFVNVRFRILPSERGIALSRVYLGSLRLPGGLVLGAVRQVLNATLGNNEGSLLLDAVLSVQPDAGQAVVSLCSVDCLEERLAAVRRRLELLRDRAAPFGDPDRARGYYRKLTEVDGAIQGHGAVSLARFVEPLFLFAARGAAPPEEENQAALLALATFLGSERVETFTGPVREPALKNHRRVPRPVTLGGREDLRLHFLISAALKVLSDRVAAHAVGEFKELLDARRGGSGFSFADLAADRAGVRFAEAALDSDGGARRLQDVLAQERGEEMFFPDVHGLPEGLSKTRFENLFGGIEDPRYAALVAAIDACIARLPAYADGEAVGHEPNREACRVANVLPPGIR